MSEKRIIRRRRAGSAGSDSEEEEGVVLSGASDDEGVSASDRMREIETSVDSAYLCIILGLGFNKFRDDNAVLQKGFKYSYLYYSPCIKCIPSCKA